MDRRHPGPKARFQIQGDIMASTRHPKMLSLEWFELHPALVSQLKGYGISLGIGTLLAVAVLLVTKLELELNMPQKAAKAVAKRASETSLPALNTGQHLDPSSESAKQLRIEALAPQS